MNLLSVSRSIFNTLESKIRGKLKTSSDWLIKFYNSKRKLKIHIMHFSSSISLLSLKSQEFNGFLGVGRKTPGKLVYFLVSTKPKSKSALTPKRALSPGFGFSNNMHNHGNVGKIMCEHNEFLLFEALMF
jgi:hypothetical protein